MRFARAIDKVRLGGKVRRSGWGNPNQYIAKSTRSSGLGVYIYYTPENPSHAYSISEADLNGVDWEDYIIPPPPSPTTYPLHLCLPQLRLGKLLRRLEWPPNKFLYIPRGFSHPRIILPDRTLFVGFNIGDLVAEDWIVMDREPYEFMLY